MKLHIEPGYHRAWLPINPVELTSESLTAAIRYAVLEFERAAFVGGFCLEEKVQSKLTHSPYFDSILRDLIRRSTL